MNIEHKVNEQFLLSFLNSLYDQWILRPWTQPTAKVNVRTVRALEAAVGRESMKSCFEQLARRGLIRIINDHENADGDEEVLELLDYVT